MKEPNRNRYRAIGALAGIGFGLAIPTALGAFLGYWLDNRWHTLPWLTMVGLFLGLAAGFMEMMTLLKRFGND
jgi:ATP synthase protein I